MTVLDSKERTRFIKFAVVGAIGSVVDIGVMNLLTQVFHFQLVLAGSISFVCAVIRKTSLATAIGHTLIHAPVPSTTNWECFSSSMSLASPSGYQS